MLPAQPADPPLPAQDEASVDVQDSVVLLPEGIGFGNAERLTVGAGVAPAIFTVMDALAFPPPVLVQDKL